MSPDEATDVSVRAKGLFPTMTLAQGGQIIKVLQIEKYANLPKPEALAIVERLAQFGPDDEELEKHRWYPTVFFDRCDRWLFQHNQDVQAQHRAEEKQMDVATALHWQGINAMVADLSDEDLEDMRPSILAKIPDGLRERYRHKPIRESKYLRSLVYAVLTKKGDPCDDSATAIR